METKQTPNGTNRIPAIDKTPEQRQAEVFELVNSQSALPPTEVMALSNKLEGQQVKLGGSVILTLPDCAPKSYVSKSGKRAGQTTYSLFNNQYEPIIINGQNGVKAFVRVSIIAY